MLGAMSKKLTKKQKLLAGLITLHRKELLKRYSVPRLAQYVRGVRIPDYETALYFAKIAGIDVDTLPYRTVNL
jgi:transcriptional regulator with XRE-family HTH domain